MKVKSILASAFAILMLGACSKEETGQEGGLETGDGAVAYLSVQISGEAQTRAGSGEQSGSTAESDLNTIYMILFDENYQVKATPGAAVYYTKITPPSPGSATTPEAQKVSANSKYLLVIANPGTKLEGVITSLNATSAYSVFAEAIRTVQTSEIKDATKGYAMISGGDDSGLNPASNKIISDPLVDISGKIQKLSAHNNNETAAKSAAEGNRADIKIERISSKVGLKLAGTITVPSTPTQAKFTFGKWALDALNSEYYPFAEKTVISGTHSPTTHYNFNFYTKDPNFTPSAVTNPVTTGEGLDFTTINSTYDPVLPQGTSWLDAPDNTYCIENTMAAAEQRYGNATRVVIKGTYYPDATWTGDWFNFAGTNYQNLAELQAAYQGGGANLVAVCDKMNSQLRTYAGANAISFDNAGTGFADLTANDLSKFPNGGELVKDGKNSVIRWYQGGLNYYYYEIRHDDETTDIMAFGKYGVVRNNWYSLTLESVAGPGTPWYPDIENPGPGDPDPVDPLDEESGYLGIKLEIAPWILWERPIGI